jgi:signal transduction histidine kinase
MSVSAFTVGDLDAERLQIARELHDVISYGFATISLQAGAAVQIVDREPQQAAEALQAIKAASREALEELRGILGVMRRSEGSTADEGGLDRLESLVETTNKAGVPTCLEGSYASETLPGAVSRAAYRIVQESLTNILRHAGQATATVTVVQDGDRLLVTVEDDGSGPDPASPIAAGSGLGVVGMRERAQALGGELEAGPRAEGGFRVRAFLPLPEGV